jgi:tetratricopeptide (TPR) repeat protein
MRLLSLAVLLIFVPCAALAQSDQDWKLCNAEDADAAIPACARLIETGNLDIKDRAIAYDSRGVAYWRKGDYDQAIVNYNKAIEIDPQFARAYMRRGAAYAGKGDYDPSFADSSKAIEIDPKNFKAYSNRSLVQARRGNYDQAVADASKAIEIDPKYPNPYGVRGYAYEGKGNYDLAIADYAKFIEIEPKNFGVARAMGLLRFVKGDFETASADLLHALGLKDDLHAMLFRYLARAHSGEGEAAKAELAENARRWKVRVWPYAFIELYLGKRLADEMLKAAVKTTDRCLVYFYVGEWHMIRNELAEAAADLNSAAELCSRDRFEYRAAIAELARLKS